MGHVRMGQSNMAHSNMGCFQLLRGNINKKNWGLRVGSEKKVIVNSGKINYIISNFVTVRIGNNDFKITQYPVYNTIQKLLHKACGTSLANLE